MSTKKKRRAQNPDAHQPDLVADLSGFLAICEHVASLVDRCDNHPSFGEVADAVASQLDGFESWDPERIPPTSRLVADAAATWLTSFLSSARRAVLRRLWTKVPAAEGDTLRTEASHIAMLSAAGYSVSSCEDVSGIDSPLFVAHDLLHHIDDSVEDRRRVSANLQRVWLAAPTAVQTGVDPATALTLRGADTERISDVLLRIEAQRHIKLVWLVANRMSGSYRDYTPEDLVGFGYQGLLRGIAGFDPDSGFRFATYAVRRIEGAILDGVRSEHHLPKRMIGVARHLSSAEDALTQELGRAPSLEELASEVGATLAQLEVLRSFERTSSLEELGHPDDDDVGWVPASEVSAEDEALTSYQVEKMMAHLGTLPAEEKEVVRLIFLEEYSLRDTAEVMGLTTGQVRRLRESALTLLRQHLTEAA